MKRGRSTRLAALALASFALCQAACHHRETAASPGSPGGQAGAVGVAGGVGTGPGAGGAAASTTGTVGSGGAGAAPGGGVVVVGGGGGGTAGATAGRGGTSVAGIALDGSPIYTRMQRLTNTQWERAVARILGFDGPANLLHHATKSPAGAADFANNERLLLVDLDAEVDFEAAAEAAAVQATASSAALAKVYAGTDSAGLVRAIGRRAFRRPLTPDEESRYQGIFALGEQLYGAGYSNGAALVIRAMLQSPKFLYRSELGTAGAPLDGYEVASKLSFSLLGTTPTDDLLDMAGAGGLDTEDGLEGAARSMLEDPAATQVMRDFHGQLYQLGLFDALATTSASPALRAELAETSYRFFDSVFTRGEGLRAILTSTRYFVGPDLAASYGLTPSPAAIEERALDSSRVGWFMQAPFLLLNGDGDNDESDPIRRGAALSTNVFCAAPEGHAPPAPSLPQIAPGQTNRQRFEQATATCGNCHTAIIDPLGFAFEFFDGLGRARDLDNGVAVDAKGSYTFASGPQSFAGARELMRIMADDTQTHACYAKKLAGYTLQRDVVERDRSLVNDLSTVSRERSIKEMIVSLIRSPAFRLRAEGAP